MIVHQPLSQDFTVIPNELLRDASLSMDAIAVACWLLSKPRDWRVNLTNLRRQFGRGHEKMQAIMRELITAGWARRERKPGPRGTFGAGDYTVFNVRQPRQTDLDLDEAENTAVGKPDSGDEGCVTGVGSTGVGNPDSLLSIESKKNGSNPPYPPVGGARFNRNPESGRRPACRARQAQPTVRIAESDKGCRGAEPPAIPPDAAARFQRLLAAYPESGRLSADRARSIAAFAALAEADQETVIRAAGVEARIRAQHRSQARALHRWLERDLWRNGELASAATDPGAERNAAGLAAAARGQWPSGCTHLVLADSAAGAAWEAHFARFGVRPRWMQLSAGLGAYMPAPIPPVAEAA